ncbi:MAG TPA: GNAT family N-acetyltransferase [Gemmatimonadaceae bacterium]|nr:GNAT family N-acetyltransferase [Gemmatimonadaceae bacterium]
MPPWLITLPDFSLRPWTRDDAPSLARTLSVSDAHLRAFTPWVVDGRVPGASLEDRLAKHAADFAAGTEWVYGMFSPDDSEVLGGCGLYPRVGPGAVEIGYWLAVHHTGRGLATQAAEALTQVAFDVLRVDRIEIRCDRDNVASVRIPERLGYRLVEEADAPANLLVFSRSRTDAPDGAA